MTGNQSIWHSDIWKRCVRASAAILTVTAIAVAPASGFEMPSYYGVCSVSIVTKKGDCIASYRYPMRIANGVLGNGGDIALNSRGRVTGNGAVHVAVSHGDSRAVGSGRLAARTGSGSWRTASCSGCWTAERRST